MRLTAIALLLFMLPVQSGQKVQGDEVEQFLQKAKFTERTPLGTGVTHSYKVTLELNGQTSHAVLKTVDQKRPGAQPDAKGKIEIDYQDSWRAEVAAYEMDKLLGLGMVPATTERMSPYDEEPASLQIFVESVMTEGDRQKKGLLPPNPSAWTQELAKIAVFDALIDNSDRHPDNLLITADFRIVAIDHSRSFFSNTQLRNKQDLLRFPKPLVEAIQKLDKSTVQKKLGSYLSSAQIDALMKRRQLLLDLVQQQIKKSGEAVTFFPQVD